MAVDAGSAVGYLDLDISGFLSNLRTAQREANSISKNMATQIGTNMTSVGKKLTSAGTTLTKTVTLPIVGIGTAAVKTSSDFESAMSKVSAISGATGSDLDALNQKAQEMGAKTKFSATESAEAFTYMAMAGWKTEDMLQGIDGIMALAAADGLDLATTSDIVTDALTAFGLSASDSGHFADVLAKAASNANTNVTLLGESFKYAAPVAGALGYSAEDTAIALGLMANAGIKGSQGGTALRSSLSRLIKPTDDAAALMEKYGLSMTNADGSMKSLGQVMDMLRNNMGDLTEAEQAQAAATLFGQEAMSGMLSIINASDADYDKLTSAIYDADGAAQSMADTMLNSLSGQLTLLKSALEGLAIQIGSILMPYIKQFVTWLQNLVQKLQELSPEQKEQIVKWAAIVAAIGPVIAIVGKLITGVGNIITVFGKLKAAIPAVKARLVAVKTAIAGISAPVAAIVAAIGVLIAAFVSLWKNNEEFRNKITAIWDQVKATFEKLTSGIVERLNRLGFDFESIGEVLKAIWKGFCDFLAPIFEGVFQYIANTFDTFVNVFFGIWDFFHALFTGDWEGCWTAVKGIFESIWNGIKDWFTNILNVITGVFDVVCGWFGTIWSDTWNSIKAFFVGLWEGIVSWFQGILTGISTFFTNIWTGISTFFTGLWNGIVSFFTNTLNSIKTTFENIWNGISTFFTNIWNTIKNVVQVGIMFIVELFNAAFQLITLPFRFIWENCKETIMSIWNTIKTTISTALTAIQTTISNVWTAVSNFFVSIWTSISTFVSTIWNQISTTVSTIINAIKTTVTNVFNSIKITITNIFNAIKTTITNVVNAVKTTITNVFNAVKTTVTNVFNSIKSTTTNVWNGIKTAITTPLNAAKTTISNVVNSVKTTISNGFNAAKNTVTNVFNSIKNSISNVMNSAKTAVQNAINNIKSKFNFSWSLPKLKMPHPKISGSFSLNPPSVPRFSIEWYKKAMGNGMILDAPTIFGFNSKTGKFLAGGEAGSETVVGTKSLMNMIRTAVKESNSEVIKTIVSYFDVVLNNVRSANENLAYSISRLVDASYQFAHSCDELGYIAYNGFTKAKDSYERNKSSNKDNGGGGDTFIFNSPKAIDEIEAAKQMKQTKRELAEGF